MSERPAEIGEVIGGYRLQNVLGQGGMGCVYEATHTRLGRRTAVKLLAPSLVSSQEYVSRFLSEAKIVNDVRHPNIVDIYDFIELENPRRVAYVMELVEGPSLGRLLKERRLTLEQAINVTFQLVSALEAVHAVGVIHRDLKPDNVLVLGDLNTDLSAVPSVKILDFGIAKSVDGDVDHKTVTGSMLGTHSNMAPEQIAANPVSGATDIYAIGEIFYEMITGSRLFSGDRMPMLSQKLLGEVPELVFPADLPAAESVRELIHWCLALDAEERPSIAELANALSELIVLARDEGPEFSGRLASLRPEKAKDPEPTAANAMASMIEEPPAGGRSRWPLVAGGIAALALAAALGVFAWQRSQPEVIATPVEATPARAPAHDTKPEPASVDAPAAESVDAEDKAAPQDEPGEKAAPEEKPEPKKQPPPATRRRRLRRRPSRLVPKEPVEKEKKRVVKKRELVPW
ncbi:MAG: serine/threonine-protein kinase [Deltaproteobacteria bacterium]